MSFWLPGCFLVLQWLCGGQHGVQSGRYLECLHLSGSSAQRSRAKKKRQPFGPIKRMLLTMHKLLQRTFFSVGHNLRTLLCRFNPFASDAPNTAISQDIKSTDERSPWGLISLLRGISGYSMVLPRSTRDGSIGVYHQLPLGKLCKPTQALSCIRVTGQIWAKKNNGGLFGFSEKPY